MTGTRVLAVVLAAAMLTAGVACTSSGTIEGPSSSTPAVVSSTSADRPPSSVATTTTQRSVTSASTSPTSATPHHWPDDLTPDQVADAQAALAAYRSYWQVVDQAVADPGQDWTAQLAAVAIGPEYDQALKDFSQTAAKGQRAVGTTHVEPVVTKVEPALVTVTACVDKSNTDFLDANGNSIKAPDSPGSYFRHVSVAQVGQFDTRWLVTNTTDDWYQTC